MPTAGEKTNQTYKSIFLLRCCQGDLSTAVHTTPLKTNPDNATLTLSLHLGGEATRSQPSFIPLMGGQFS